VRTLDRLTDRAWPVVVTVGAVVGLALRLYSLRGKLGVLDSDEAVVGLMAGELRHGHLRAFFWGQHYAGTVETAVVAVVLAVFGASVAALKGAVMALSAVTCLLTWRVGRRLVDDRTAQVGALLLWVGASPYLWYATKARGFYWAAMILGLLLVLCALRIDQEGDRPRDWLGLGLSAGLGWWVSPTVAYFALPAGLWLLWRRRDDLGALARRLPLVAGAFVVGALPWLWHNVGAGLPSLESPEQPVHVGYLTGIGRLLGSVVPMILDLRRPVLATWVPLGAVTYVVVVVGLGLSVLRRRDRPVLVVLAVLLFPLLYGVFPGRWWIGEGRYALFLAPFLFLLLAWALWSRAAQLGVLTVTAVASAFLLAGMGGEQPRHVGGDIRALEAAGVSALWSDYWTSYRITYESRLDIVSSSALSARHQPYVDRLTAAGHPAWGYRRGDDRAQALSALLTDAGIAVRRFRTPHLDVVVADRPVDPETIPPHLRL
jgi:hypothetical protein